MFEGVGFMMRILSVLSILIISNVAGAFPLPTANIKSVQLPKSFSANYDFEGIIELSNCSGSLIRLDSSRDSDSALVLTNGHCLGGFMEPGEVIVGEPSSRSFNVLDRSGSRAGRLEATQILYATMTRTDMAIYKVNSTYAEIQNRYHVRPLRLASTRPEIGTPIEVVSGYWKRGYSCAVETIVHQLKEADWLFERSVRYTRPGCEVIGGTSGSPVIEIATRSVIAINNTGNESGRRCTMNNPCEIDENGDITFQEGYSYAQQTYWLYGCLNELNELDLNKAGCELPH